MRKEIQAAFAIEIQKQCLYISISCPVTQEWEETKVVVG